MSVPSLALAVHGRLTPRATGPPAGDQDCYSTFLALSVTLGWNSAMDGTSPGSWGMNEAGGPYFGDDDTSLCGWFQVGPEGDSGTPLPVEALTVAAVWTLERFGALELEGLEYYVPLGAAGAAARRVLEGQAWFALAPPGERTRLRVTLDSGDSLAVVERRDAIVQALELIAPDEEGLDAALPPGQSPAEFAATVPWRWWLGDGASHTLTLVVVASEWSPLGLGRVVSCLVEACRGTGMIDPIGIRVARA